MGSQPRLRIAPITLREANRFVGQEHRHHPPTRGHKLSQAVIDENGVLRGVGILGRPVSRVLQDAGYLELLRVCTDGTPNACSALYGAAARVGKEMGYHRSKIITYTLADEPGTSLLAAGWVLVARTDGGEWSRPSRRRKAAADPSPKNRWHAAMPEMEVPSDEPGTVALSLL